MKIPDANVLLYAVNFGGPNHERSRVWLEQALSEGQTVAFPWIVLMAFLRLSTKPGIFPTPLKVEQAFNIVESWLAAPCATVLEPGRKHVSILRDLLSQAGTGGNLVTDAHLAAMAIEAGASLISFDRDFGRFPGLRWRMP